VGWHELFQEALHMDDAHRHSAVISVTALNFEREVLEANLPVLVDVSATWCAPCKAAHPIIEALAHAHRGRLKVVSIDGGESPDLVDRLGVRGYPTFLGISRGAVVERRVGFGGRRALDELARTMIETSAPVDARAHL
jgi:thioredoxin 1